MLNFNAYMNCHLIKKGYVTMNEVPASEIMNLLEKKENILVTLEEEIRR